jgi:hypothetical protein
MGWIGKIALAIHLKKNPTHTGRPNDTAIGVKSYVCETCNFPFKQTVWVKK